MKSSYKHRTGDRKDGRLLRSLPPYNKFLPFVMPHSSNACNYYEESFEVSAADKCLRQERVNGHKDIGFTHFMIAAYIRCLSMLPGVNRFSSGRRIYARNTITVVLSVRRSVTVDSSEAKIKVDFEPTDTIFDVYRKINEKIDEIRSGIEGNSTEELAESFARMPRPLLRVTMFGLRVMDYFGWLPQNVVKASPYHASVEIDNMASLRTGPVFHHTYDFGNLPVFISFGAKRHAYEPDRTGNIVSKKYIDAKFTIDERIADSHYYSQFLQAMRYIFSHPEILERTPSRVIEDVG